MTVAQLAEADAALARTGVRQVGHSFVSYSSVAPEEEAERQRQRRVIAIAEAKAEARMVAGEGVQMLGKMYWQVGCSLYTAICLL